MNTQLSPGLILGLVGAYFLLLIFISLLTGKDTSNDSFFRANRKSPWFLIAFGMVGSSLSGVTFISIPGVVGMGGANMNLSYMQMVFGYLLGYFVIATVLMPIYYRLNLTTIYGYLRERLGVVSYRMGAFYFLLSRLIGSAFRLYLVAIVLQAFVMDSMGISFGWTVAGTILLILVYTFRGGIKTIVWTDTLQTAAMLLAVILTILFISKELGLSLSGMWKEINTAGYQKMFYFEGGWSDPNNFWKQFISGALIAVVMTGLDQDMMQKNLTCKTLPDAQKNMFSFSIILVFVNFLFLTLGGLLYVYAAKMGIDTPARSDLLYPTLAIQHLGGILGILFILGLIAAAYSSADSALTALTTSFCVDFLDFERKERSEIREKRLRFASHVGFAVLSFVIIIIFRSLNNDAIINELFTIAGYTYGPLLGLFSFGIMTRRKIKDKYASIVCVAAPVISYIVNTNSVSWLNGFSFGFLILAFNGILTFAGLWFISLKTNS